MTKIRDTMELPSSLNHFLTQTDSAYRSQLRTIPLFNNDLTSTWNEIQKKSFAAIFYHIRGEFINFMWYLANFASDEMTKKIVLENIAEELGTDNKFSHEKLYQRFALECGVDINHEIVNETHRMAFVKQFNKGHIRWLTEHDADERIAAFAAYERLDNIDYPFLTDFATTLNISSQGMSFFRVHTFVEHFSAVLEKLLPIWEASPEKVEKGFDFIFSHQLQMWQQLSNVVFAMADRMEAVG